MNKELSIIKFDIETASDIIANSEVEYVLKSGEVDEVNHFLKIKKLHDVCGKVLKNDEYVNLIEKRINELGGSHKENGASVSLKSARKEFSYTPDDELTEQESRIDFAKDVLKHEQEKYEKMLSVRRGLDKSETVVNEETGEIVTRYPAYETTSAKKTLTVTFKK